MSKTVSRFLAMALLAGLSGAAAQAQPATPAPQQNAGAKTPAMTEGEIRKLDKAAATVTLRHGPIVNLGMPGMTMVFKLSNPKLAAAFKPGDKVRFTVDKIGEQYVVTQLEAAQ